MGWGEVIVGGGAGDEGVIRGLEFGMVRPGAVILIVG